MERTITGIESDGRLSVFLLFFFFSGLIVVVFLFCFIFACEVTQPFSVLASHKVFLFAG